MIQTPVDLRSDTVTQPTPEMRQAMMNAQVGDHVLGDDPTANELERRCAELLGKEWSLFMPSGTMANQIGVHISSRPGTEVVVDQGAHLVHFEEGGAAVWSGVQLRTVASDGVLDVEATVEAFRGANRHVPETSLLCVENTHNTAGGRVMSVERMAELAGLAKERGVSVHLDGARLPNAAVATGRGMIDWTRHVDTVMMSLSKGLGAPIGSVLAGPAHLFDRAWRARRRMGGGMRQVGMLAAAALFALENNFERLEEDHRRAGQLASGLSNLPGLTVSSPETNIVMIDVEGTPGDADIMLGSLKALGVLVSRFGPTRFRAVTHLGIDDAGLERAIDGFRSVTAVV